MNEWIDDMLKVAGEPRGSVRLVGERWAGFVHERIGGILVGWYNTNTEARLAVARAASERLGLAVRL